MYIYSVYISNMNKFYLVVCYTCDLSNFYETNLNYSNPYLSTRVRMSLSVSSTNLSTFAPALEELLECECEGRDLRLLEETGRWPTDCWPWLKLLPSVSLTERRLVATCFSLQIQAPMLYFVCWKVVCRNCNIALLFIYNIHIVTIITVHISFLIKMCLKHCFLANVILLVSHSMCFEALAFTCFLIAVAFNSSSI